MKKITLALLFSFGAALFFGGCDKPDYQHPLHRTGDK